GSDKELVLPYEETGSLPMQQFHREDATSFLGLMTQSLELSPHSSGDQTGVLMLDSKAEITENHMQEGLYIGSELNLEASAQNVGTAGISMLLPNQSDVPLGPKSNGEDAVSLEVESHTATHSGSPGSLREIMETPESTTAVIPTLDTGAQARFNYVKAVIEASGLSTIDFSGRCHLGDQLLARSLFDEVEISSSPQIDDPKLLFDCINEALEEIFKCPPWVCLNTSNAQQAPVAQSLIREVSSRIERQISAQLPNSLGQMVTMDLETGSRLDLQPETKNIVDEIWETLLDDLVDETIFDLWLDHSAGW
ncbi:unnamed protein product, partial [Musa hybrid cultivar]